MEGPQNLGASNFGIFLDLKNPDPWGKMIQFDEHIFQMGWVNHQLENDGPEGKGGAF